MHYEFGGLIFGGAYFLNFKVPVAAHECTLASLTAENSFSGKGKWEARIMEAAGGKGVGEKSVINNLHP